MKIVVSGGGTGGHIYPALAFVRTVKELEPNSEVLYIGTKNGLESSIVPKANIPFKTIYITGFRRSLSLENVKTVVRFLRGVRESKQMLKQFKPDIVLGTGGYVCGPVVYAAHKLNIPTVIHEQNSIPGLTNKFLSRYVDKVAISFEESAQFFPTDKTVFTGNPRATEVLGKDGSKALTSLGLDPMKKTVLVVGGSRGATPINEAVLKILPEVSGRSYQLLYVTGEVHYDSVIKEYQLAGKPANVYVRPFIHNMEEVLAGVDLVVSRAGATFIAEFTSLGKPAILIPSPYVTNNHQVKNAESLMKKDAAVVILEKDLSSKKLLEEMDKVLSDGKRLEQMSKASKKLGIQDASLKLFSVCKKLIL